MFKTEAGNSKTSLATRQIASTKLLPSKIMPSCDAPRSLGSRLMPLKQFDQSKIRLISVWCVLAFSRLNDLSLRWRAG